MTLRLYDTYTRDLRDFQPLATPEVGLNEAKMSKSSGDFVRLQTLLDRDYDPLAYRYFCLGAHYRARLSFTWRGLDGATTALNRLRALAYAWGQPGKIDEDYADRFSAQVNDDLNLPRAMAVLWELAKSDRPEAVKKATLLQSDRVLGLGLAEWQPAEAIVPADIWQLVQQRQQARTARQWPLADQLRAQIGAAGYEIEDTPAGPQLRRLRVKELA